MKDSNNKPDNKGHIWITSEDFDVSGTKTKWQKRDKSHETSLEIIKYAAIFMLGVITTLICLNLTT